MPAVLRRSPGGGDLGDRSRGLFPRELVCHLCGYCLGVVTYAGNTLREELTATTEGLSIRSAESDGAAQDGR